MVKVIIVSNCSDFPVNEGKHTEEFNSMPTWRQVAEKCNLSSRGFLDNASGTLVFQPDDRLIQNMELYFVSGMSGYVGKPIYSVLVI